MKNRFRKTFIMLIIAVTMMLSPVTSPITTINVDAATITGTYPQVVGENWMSWLPNTSSLSEINLPGTHDSGTRYIMGIQMVKALAYLNGLFAASAGSVALIPYVGIPAAAAITTFAAAFDAISLLTNPGNLSFAPFAQDQALSIPEQLDAGVRLLDCRLSNFKGSTNDTDDLELSHGGIHCLNDDGDNLTMKEVLGYCKEFVKNHPTETVVVGMRHESFFPVPSEDDNWFLDKVFKMVHKVFLNEIFDGVELDKIAKNADPLITKLIKEELPNDPDCIVIDDWKDLPTVGEARGKIVICEKTDATLEANKVSDYSSDGNTKWEHLQAYFKSVEDGNIKQDYSKSSNKRTLSESSCTDSDGVYMQNSAKILALKLKLVDLFIDLFNIDNLNARSGGEVQSKIVNPKFKAYDLKKGYYYGWMYMDFVDRELLSHYYNSNIFDFDVAGGQLEYISDITIAYDQQFGNAKFNLKQLGYQTLEDNFNAEGPDKGLSDAIVNGVRNRGSFNMAIGYKTTTNVLDAITGIIWINKPYEGAPLDEKTQGIIDKYNFQLVQTSGTKIETDKLKGIEGYCNLNIGTASRHLVNLYTTKDQNFGERITSLESVQGYNITNYDVMKNKEFSQRDIDNSNSIIEDNFRNRNLEMPRDINGFVLSSNYGRPDMNDVYIFYGTTFNDPSWGSAYIKSYDGPYAGEICDINYPDDYFGKGIPEGYEDEIQNPAHRYESDKAQHGSKETKSSNMQNAYNFNPYSLTAYANGDINSDKQSVNSKDNKATGMEKPKADAAKDNQENVDSSNGIKLFVEIGLGALLVIGLAIALMRRKRLNR